MPVTHLSLIIAGEIEVNWLLTQQIHHSSNTGAQIVLHIRQTVPEHVHHRPKLLRQPLHDLLRDRSQTRRSDRPDIVILITKTTTEENTNFSVSIELNR